MTVDPKERAARIAWARLSEPLETTMWSWVASYGHVQALERVRAGALGSDRVVGPRSRAFDLTAEEAMAAKLGARILVAGDEEWPDRLEDLPVPPHALWVTGGGHLAELSERSVSIVGARASTPYGLDAAMSLAAGMAGRGFMVMSGGAYGIDAAAHQGVLATDGATVAAIACGIDRAYPLAHRAMLQRIAERGCVVTELPPGSAPLAGRFIARNRMIAAMTAGTVVVEAGLRSGSLNTARTALALNRVVAAVPGPITSGVSAGCHELLRESDAVLVTDAAELAEAVGEIGRDLAPRRHRSYPDEEWKVTDRIVHAWVPVRRPAVVDELAGVTELSEASVQSSLTRLEAAGAVRRSAAGWQKVAHPRGPRPRG